MSALTWRWGLKRGTSGTQGGAASYLPVRLADINNKVNLFTLHHPLQPSTRLPRHYNYITDHWTRTYYGLPVRPETFEHLIPLHLILNSFGRDGVEHADHVNTSRCVTFSGLCKSSKKIIIIKLNKRELILLTHTCTYVQYQNII